MKLYMKQKVFTWKDKFIIKDANEIDKYYVEGELFSWGHKLHMYNADMQEVAFINQKLLTWLPKFEVYINETLAVEVVKEFTFFKPKYTLQGTDWTVDGDFWDHNYMITNGLGVIATISKAWFSWGDSYELDIAEAADEELVVATVLAIDCVISSQAAAAAASSAT